MAAFLCKNHQRNFTRQAPGEEPWCPECLAEDEAREQAHDEYLFKVAKERAEPSPVEAINDILARVQQLAQDRAARDSRLAYERQQAEDMEEYQGE